MNQPNERILHSGNPALDRRRVRETLDQLRQELLAQRTSQGHWVGRLAPSALSTATAVSALSALLLQQQEGDLGDADGARVTANGSPSLTDCITCGVDYLRAQQNADGGFGDTDRSHSNIATSYLILAASTLANRAVGRGLEDHQRSRLEQYIDQAGGRQALRERYGTDKTFVVPILTNLAIAGLVDWNSVPPLPFEAAVFPQSMYRLLRMPVVSYAIPALVAIGQARYFLGPKPVWPLRHVRELSVDRTMRVLKRMQPESGGYLEATPLTSFVLMSLAATERGDSDVAKACLRFLRESMSEEGSWPIDTNLATWVTSLAVQALAADPDDDGAWCTESLIQWHLRCQHRQRHPFTGAEPGGWGWSDLSGAVPDSDDTPAAILALTEAHRCLVKNDQSPAEETRGEEPLSSQIEAAVQMGREWLLKLQNRDGGWPTFCRGWGKLPFDRSSTDLTAHAIRAFDKADSLTEGAGPGVGVARAVRCGVGFLRKNQRADGAWLPLWFGNQDEPEETNPVYGTARVLLAGRRHLGEEAVRRGVVFLVRCQNQDGGWGGGRSLTDWLARQDRSGVRGDGDAEAEYFDERKSQVMEPTSSVEETALAVEALVHALGSCTGAGDLRVRSVDAKFDPPGKPGGAGNSTNLDSSPRGGGNDAHRAAIIRGVEFLLRAVSERRHEVPWPIGFYFAKLWYHEQLYPLVFTISSLGRYLSLMDERREE